MSCLPGNTGLDKSFAIHVHNDTVLGHLFLDENDLFDSLDDKISTRVQGALVHPGQLQLVLSGQDTV